MIKNVLIIWFIDLKQNLIASSFRDIIKQISTTFCIIFLARKCQIHLFTNSLKKTEDIAGHKSRLQD